MSVVSFSREQTSGGIRKHRVYNHSLRDSCSPQNSVDNPGQWIESVTVGQSVLPIGAFSPIGFPATPDLMTQSSQCWIITNLGILVARLPVLPDCPIGRCSPYYRLLPPDWFTDSIHWTVIVKDELH